MRGMIVNHKRVARLMVADDLLAVRRRAFVSTTRSNHDFEVYFNLAARPFCYRSGTGERTGRRETERPGSTADATLEKVRLYRAGRSWLRAAG
jgi:transposase InsO family protein